MASDLISRAAVLEAVYYKSNSKTATEAINEVPAADAVPVVHGRWKPIYGQYSKWQICSKCGVAVPESAVHWCKASEDKNLNYCPHCGARMDGGEDDE